MIQWKWPWGLAIIAIAILVYLILPKARTGNYVALRVPFYSQWLNSVAQVGRTRWLNRVLWILALSCFGLALARPIWVGDPLGVPVTGRDMMMAVDISGSMDTADMSTQGVPLTRLAMVKRVAEEFIDRRVGDRIGLILFGKRAYLQAPLTFDRDTVAKMLDESIVGLAGRETAIGDAIGLAVKRLREYPADQRLLILLTDGANTAGAVTPLKAAELAALENVKIYTIGVGADSMTVQGLLGSHQMNPSADLDEKTLTEIAFMTGGAYFRAKDAKGLEAIYRELDRLEPSAKDNQVLRPEREMYFWPLAVFLILSLIILLRSQSQTGVGHA